MLGLKEIINKINDNYSDSAIGAFNVNDMTDMHGVMNACAKLNKPLIMMVSTSAVKYFGIHFIREMYRAAKLTCPTPIFLMLDHSEDFETTVQCIANGFPIVMFDGSKLSFEENVKQTKEIVRIAHATGILVEGEIGKLPGREENINMSEKESALTKPKEAKVFYEETKVDLLAISFGTAHGFYKAQPKLNFDIIEKTRELTGAPLVMHGGTGIPAKDIKKAISLGVKKVNIGTELKKAYSSSMRKYSAQLKDEIDPRKILKYSKEAIQRVVEEKLDFINTPTIEELE